MKFSVKLILMQLITINNETKKKSEKSTTPKQSIKIFKQTKLTKTNEQFVAIINLEDTFLN